MGWLALHGLGKHGWGHRGQLVCLHTSTSVLCWRLERIDAVGGYSVRIFPLVSKLPLSCQSSVPLRLVAFETKRDSYSIHPHLIHIPISISCMCAGCSITTVDLIYSSPIGKSRKDQRNLYAPCKQIARASEGSAHGRPETLRFRGLWTVTDVIVRS